MLVIVATNEEYRKFKPYFKHIIQTGVGFANVFNSLKNIDRKTKILNIGYAGSNSIPIGTICPIKYCLNYHPNVSFEEPIYTLYKGQNKGYTCFSANDFVKSTPRQEPVVFDMELYAILSMGFTNVKSIKIISDNLSLSKYQENIK